MTMHKHRLFWAWEHEEEEKWLAEMESEGWHFKRYYFFGYEFEKGEPNRYQYRLEMLPNLPSHPESRKYIEFMEDMGVEMVGSYMRWVYFRKPMDAGPFELYSDVESRIRHLKGIYRLLWLPLILLACNLLNLINLANQSFLAEAICLLLPLLILLPLILSGIQRIRDKIHRLEKEQQIRE